MTATDERLLDNQITPLGGAFAARIDGVTCGRSLRAARTPQALRRALAEHKVLVFPGQHLSPDELIAAGRLFGELTLAHPVMPPIDAEHPEVLEIDATRSRTDPALPGRVGERHVAHRRVVHARPAARARCSPAW